MCPETIRRRAFECMQFAQNTDDPQHRAVLLELARSWAELANAMEQYQRFTETAEPLVISRVDPKEMGQKPRVVQRRRDRADQARSPKVHHRRKQAQVLPKRGIARR
jgi:hypothetical protein